MAWPHKQEGNTLHAAEKSPSCHTHANTDCMHSQVHTLTDPAYSFSSFCNRENASNAQLVKSFQKLTSINLVGMQHKNKSLIDSMLCRPYH